MSQKTSLQGTLQLGGRGLDRITKVVHYTERDKYTLFIDTKHGEREVMELRMDTTEVAFFGNTRVHPFCKMEVSQNAAKNLRRDIRSNFDVEKKSL